MLKETDTKETTLSFLVTFLSLVAFQLGAGPLAPPAATPMNQNAAHNFDDM